ELEEHVRWAKSQEVVPVIKALREKATIIARGEAERTLGHMRDADPKTAKSIAAMSNAIVNKLLHPVLTKLKAASRDGGAHDYVDALTELFDLETSAELEAKPAAETPTNVVSIDSRKAGGMS
ncbi:MAG: hypothetical protein AAFU79_22280, partial [Myxococcota bacterium]